MPVTAFEKDREASTITVTYEIDVPAERAWELWADPRQLERWWGPPAWPATFERFEFTPGGIVTYAMRGPGNERAAGWWQVLEVSAPRFLVVEDRFGDPQDAPSDLPVGRMTLDITDRSNGCTMRLTTTFPNPEALDQILEMGVEEG